MSEGRPEWVRSDVSVDVRGECCPIPEMTVAKKLRKVDSGQVIEVLTDHQPAADVTLPALAKGLGYPFYAEKNGDHYRVYIGKK